MRDALLALIVASVSFVGIAVPRIAMYGYIWFSLMRPDILAYSPVRPYSKILAISVLVGSLRFVPGFFRLVNNPFLFAYLGLQVTYLISVFFAIDKDQSLAEYIPFLQMSLVLACLPILIQSMKDMRTLMVVISVSLGLLGARFGLGALLAGGVHFAQGYGGALSDNNIVAMAMAASVPLMWYGQELTHSKFVRLGFVVVAGLTAVGSIMFNSRGGFLTLGAVLFMIVWRTKRRLYALVLMAAFMVPGTFLVWDTVSQRLNQLVNYEEEGSATSRLAYWKAAARLSLDYPLFGTGFGGGNTVKQLSRYLPDASHQVEQGHFVHNTYMQILADSGYPALFFYCCLLFGSIIWLWKFTRSPESDGEGKRPIALALQTCLVGLAVGTTFLSRVLFDYTYIMFLTTATLYSISKADAAPVAVVSTPTPANENADPLSARTSGSSPPPVPAAMNEWRASARERRKMLRRVERNH